MAEPLGYLLHACVIGVIATMVMDLWAWALRVFGVTSLDYALVGRWLGHLPRGVLAHPAIGRAPPVRGEAALGWSAHYLIGIVFAVALVAMAGPGWLARPTIWPALLTGWVTVLAPFLILQPALGLGVAAARTPKPGQARIKSLVTHTVFGVGLFVGAWLLAGLAPVGG